MLSDILTTLQSILNFLKFIFDNIVGFVSKVPAFFEYYVSWFADLPPLVVLLGVGGFSALVASRLSKLL